MEATAPSPAVTRTLRRQRRLPLAQLLFAAAGVALLLLCGAYALRFVGATAFHKERAFRVLEEIGGQLDNLQRTLTNQLRLMPQELVGSKCALEFANPTTMTALCRDRRENYQRRLALQGPKIDVAKVSKELYARACPQKTRYSAVLRVREPRVPFSAFSCAMETQEAGEGMLQLVAFQGSLADTIEGFVAQSFFDEVLVALEDGTVIATIPRVPDAVAVGAQLHPAKVRRLGIANVTALVQPEPGKEKAQAVGLPAQPEVLSTKIADDNYRVFVRAVQPQNAVYAEQEDVKAALRQERLFIVGLKREDVRAELASSIEPGGKFLLTILSLLAFLVWPLANLRSKSLDDPIAWTEAVACLAAIVLIPAVLAIATVWVWSYQGLLTWVDAAAVRYSQSVASTLGSELRESRRLLAQYRSLYIQGPIDTSAIPIRSRDDGGFVTGRVGPTSCNKIDQDRTCVIDVADDQAQKWRGWSTFSSVFATDKHGAREGIRYTVYDPPLVKSDASYDTREYFRSLQRNEGWAVTEPGTDHEDFFVAQRLFNGTDGSRSLQVAMPRPEGQDCKGGFCGIVTGSASIHSLAASVAPPLLNFAVIDRNSGVVLFHSNDSRSLTENFFIETERNPQLLALAGVGQSGSFTGRYVGTGHRFFHLPVEDTPWSVVVFYSLKEVGDMPWHAVFTALAAYVGVLLVVFVASCVAVWFFAKRRREGVLTVAARFWMRAGLSCSYARWGLALFAIGLGLITMYEASVGGPVSLITLIMWAVLALSAGAVMLQHRLRIHNVCIALWLVLISVIPAAWMALGYHDVQVEGLLRDGFVNAARDIQHRSDLIAGDLRRWLSSGENRDQDFPERAQLARPSKVLPVPGYAADSCDGSGGDQQENIWAMCVFDEPPLATLIARRPLDFWRRETWDASVQAETQQRRIRLLGRNQGATSSCVSKGTAEECTFHTADGGIFKVRAVAASATQQEVDDDRSFDGIAGATLGVLAMLMTLLVTWLLSAFISRRLLGVDLQVRACHANAGPTLGTRRGVLFYTRRVSSDEVDRILLGLRPDGSGNSDVTRVNLATKALYTELAAERWRVGRLLLTNLEIALADASRRRDILDVLERLVDNSRVQVLILCRSSPIELLYHPERYPEFGPQHVLAVEEALRWDNVLQKFECRDIENTDAPRSHAHLLTVDYHRIWKTCTRSERLLLYELARGRLANPRNTAVIDTLIDRGLLRLDPWPKIADRNFAAFVRTAETNDDLAQWQQDAAQAGGRRVRSIIIAILLVTLLMAVLWFSWSAGDKFKIVSAIVAGSVAFLGQIGQAFTFVRGGAGAGRSSG